MAELTAEQIGRLAIEMRLVTDHQMDAVWSEFRTRDIAVDTFCTHVVRRGLLTNFQLERLKRNQQSGYFHGEYKLLYLVGVGSFARVYRAVHISTRQSVVVKVLNKHFRDDEKARTRFLREGEVGMALRHPNIVPVFEVRPEPHASYMILEFVEGRTLKEFMKIRGRLEPIEATRLMIDITAGLAYAHGQGVLHRDLKPSNVLIASNGQARLVDFGLAGFVSTADETSGEWVNPRTLDYAALERASGSKKDDPRSDVYFAGCMYYHMLTGRPPFPDVADRLARRDIFRFRHVSPMNAPVASCVEDIVMQSMDLDVSHRYQTPGEMMSDLGNAQEKLAQQPPSPTPAEVHPDKNEPEGHGRTILIVESHEKLQTMFRDGLKKHGYRVLLISDADRAMDRFLDPSARIDVVVFGTSKLETEALEAFNRMATFPKTKNAPAILVLDQKHEEYRGQAKTADHRIILKIPLSMKQLREALNMLIYNKEHSEQ